MAACGSCWTVCAAIAHVDRPTVGTPVPIEEIADAYVDADGLTSRAAFTFLVDREGNVWVGTAQGLDRFSEPSLKAPLQSAENLKVVRGLS